MANMVASLFAAMIVASQGQIDAIQPPIALVSISAAKGIAAFRIGKFEVTKAQFRAFVLETGYDGAAFPSSKSSEPFLNEWNAGTFPKGQERYPVCNVNWHHAKAFCAWLAKKSGMPVRLPTDAEWTLAAAGASGRKYPWGNRWEAGRCNTGTAEDGFPEAAPVGSFPRGATPEGVQDMAGNIWEWTAEGHLRGGPWCMGPETVLCATIAHEDTERCDDKFGLRIVVGR